MTAEARMQRGNTCLLLVDVQARLTPHIHESRHLLAAAQRMLRAADILGLPILITEQYPQGLGETVPELLEAVREPSRLQKMTFSVWQDEGCRHAIGSLNRPNVLIVGIETHVCVQQTALDLHQAGLRPVLLADAVSSRRPLDRDVAFDRLRSAGIVITTVESAIFQLLERAGTDLFRQILPLVR